MYISLTGIIIFLFVAPKLQSVIEIQFSYRTKLTLILFICLNFKIVGIAYIAEFGAQICKDAGEGVIASKIEFAGKVLIMIMAVPILIALTDLIVKMIP